MTQYIKSTNFTTKDALLTGNPSKLVRGTELDIELNAIQTAINSKADAANPTFTGTTTLAALAVTGNETVGGTLVVTGALSAASIDGGTF
jgi:hypothetical protein